jgi:hypothetical protein
MKAKSFSCIVIILLVLAVINFCFLQIKPALGQEEKIEEKSWLIERGFAVGHNLGKMKGDKKFESIFFSYLLGYDLKPIFKKLHIGFPGKLQLNFAPFCNPILAPNSNVEFGFDLLLKYSFPIMKKFWPYVEAGNGWIYSTQHTPEQSTQWNFLSQIGAGFSFFVKENVSLNLGYRYRHYSNSSTKEPNKGIDSSMYIIGISFHR